MNNYKTAAIKMQPAELTKEIMRNADVQTAERLKTEQVERRKKRLKSYEKRKG